MPPAAQVRSKEHDDETRSSPKSGLRGAKPVRLIKGRWSGFSLGGQSNQPTPDDILCKLDTTHGIVLMNQTTWQIRLLGGMRAEREGQEVTSFPRRKMAVLLAWLAGHPKTSHSREMLAEMLWPDEDPEPVQDRFRHVLLELRKLLEPEGIQRGSVLTSDSEGVQLNLASVEIDVSKFESGLRAAARANDPQECLAALLEGLEQYGGELLPGFYEDWILQERERLAERHRSALSDAADRLADCGRLAQAIELAGRAVDGDPTQEDSNSLLMKLHARAGRPAEVERQYRRFERALKIELDQSPSPAAKRLFEQLMKPASGPEPIFGQATETNQAAQRLAPTGGAVPLESNFYLLRPVDGEMSAAIAHRDSIVLLKGARQTGKTSLLGRGLELSRKNGMKTLITDLQKFTADQMATPDALFRLIAETMIDELEIEIDIDSFWRVGYGWNVNFERFMRRFVIAKPDDHFVWALDEVDRLFAFTYSTEAFGLFRSWHNERSLNPDGVWSRLTLCIAYATEVHLFIKDLNQSPFNVGTRLTLGDFSEDQVGEMNQRYGSPLRTTQERSRFFRLLGGNPYLVRRGLELLVNDQLSLGALEERGATNDGPFGDPLRRMIAIVRSDPMLVDAVQLLFSNQPCQTPEVFYRLKSAGVIVGASASQVAFRSQLYRGYLDAATWNEFLYHGRNTAARRLLLHRAFGRRRTPWPPAGGPVLLCTDEPADGEVIADGANRLPAPARGRRVRRHRLDRDWAEPGRRAMVRRHSQPAGRTTRARSRTRSVLVFALRDEPASSSHARAPRCRPSSEGRRNRHLHR